MRSTCARLAAGAALLLTLTGCPTVPESTVVSVAIPGGDLTLAIGDSTVLTADVQTIGNASTSVTWNSSVPTIASITADGTLEALTAGTTTITATSTADPGKSDAISVTVDPPGRLRWTRQFGTGSNDDALGIASDDDGTTYVAGRTSGSLQGTTAGLADAFVHSYDATGEYRWTRQFGTAADDEARGVATDAIGNVYVAGYSFGTLDGVSAGGPDAFVRSYDADGDVRWTRQFGTSGTDVANAVATDTNGNVYVAGYTFGTLEGTNAGDADAYVRSYDANGNARWVRQFGTTNYDAAQGVATDADGNVYIVGSTTGGLEGASSGFVDVFVRSFDFNGNLRWTRQFGTSGSDEPNDVATDANGHVYVVGYTFGALVGTSAGERDAFVRSYDATGTLRWTRQFGTSATDVALGVSTDPDGDVVVAGYTTGALEGTSAGLDDAFVRRYDNDGNLRWTRQFGTEAFDGARGVTTDADGVSYVTGFTVGALDGANAGGRDAFVLSFGP